MADRLIRISRENSFGMPYQTAKRILDIMVNNNDEYYAKYSKMNQHGKRDILKKPVSKIILEELLQNITTITIPAFPIHHLGCDGGVTELEIGRHSGDSIYRWWSVPPKGWEVLDELVDKIVKLSGIDEL